ncbi:MAG: hypothetical protein ACI915_005215, partial [Gammaproteobacteria bacterium]
LARGGGGIVRVSRSCVNSPPSAENRARQIMARRILCAADHDAAPDRRTARADRDRGHDNRPAAATVNRMTCLDIALELIDLRIGTLQWK